MNNFKKAQKWYICICHKNQVFSPSGITISQTFLKSSIDT